MLKIGLAFEGCLDAAYSIGAELTYNERFPLKLLLITTNRSCPNKVKFGRIKRI